jgi:Holliday junction resolvase RusA-like endonuclease
MTQHFFIPGPLPGLNEILKLANQRRGKWNAYDDLKHTWDRIITVHIQQAKLVPVERAYFTFVWLEAHRRRDLDNIAVARKFVLDALVATQILNNDGWRHVLGWTDSFVVDVAAPGVDVTLTTEEEGA